MIIINMVKIVMIIIMVKIMMFIIIRVKILMMGFMFLGVTRHEPSCGVFLSCLDMSVQFWRSRGVIWKSQDVFGFVETDDDKDDGDDGEGEEVLTMESETSAEDE